MRNIVYIVSIMMLATALEACNLPASVLECILILTEVIFANQ